MANSLFKTAKAIAPILPLLLCACASLHLDPQAHLPLDSHRLPAPDMTLSIHGLGPCTDQPDRDLHLKQGEPVVILVHGCGASSGRFRTLAQVFAYQGQQAICYTYDDRESLVRVAGDLRLRLNQLAGASANPPLTLIGHSLGGLVARRALRDEPHGSGDQDPVSTQLVTLSTPFAGIASADHCASPTTRLLSLGLIVPVCWAISGEKWFEITHASDFMRQPGRLIPGVERHLQIMTDEQGSCRQEEGGRCVEDDYVFSLPEQRLPVHATDQRLQRHTLRAGHAEVVGKGSDVPLKLIGLLQEEGLLRPAEVARAGEFRRYLVRLYSLDRKVAGPGTP